MYDLCSPDWIADFCFGKKKRNWGSERSFGLNWKQLYTRRSKMEFGIIPSPREMNMTTTLLTSLEKHTR